jgi:hypothetical protein
MTKHTLTARIALFLALAALAPLAAQSGEGTASFSAGYVVKNYTGVRVEDGTARGATRYTDDISFEDEKLFGGLDGGKAINKPHELIAATAVLNIKEVVPADALKVYAEIAMEGAANSFLGVTGTTHGQVLERLRGKYNFTQAEINGAVRETVAAVVDAEFNKISFMMNNDTIRKGYSTTLTRTVNNQYILEYDGIYQGKDFYAKLPPASLETLLVTMRGDTINFDKNCIDTVRAQAAQIPAVRLSKEAVNEIAVIVEQFYTKPTTETYGYLIDVYNLYILTWLALQNRLFESIADSYIRTLSGLSQPLARKVIKDRDITSNIVLSREVQRKLTSFQE